MTKTIRVDDDTYSALCKRGKFGDTMNDIIVRLLKKKKPRKKLKSSTRCKT